MTFIIALKQFESVDDHKSALMKYLQLIQIYFYNSIMILFG